MARYIIQRILTIIPLTIIMAILIFSLMRLLPGDPATVILGPDASLEDIEALRSEMHLDRSIVIQIGSWLLNLARGDLGHSFYYNMPVGKMLLRHIVPTLKLTILSLLTAVLFGTIAGILCAVRQDSYTDRILVVLSTSCMALPNMWLGLLLALFFGVVLRWFPVAGYESFAQSGLASLKYLVLPTVTLALAETGILAKLVRSRMLDVLHKEYILTARSKGLPYWKVVIKHAFKNSMTSVLTVSGMMLAALIGGAVIIENIFAVPGMGQLMITAIQRRDYMVVQSAILAITFFYLFLNFLVDVLYAVLDPRISYGSSRH